MNRFFTPLILVICAVALFVVYTNPAYHGAQALQAKASTYDEALNKSQELRKLRDQLLAKRNTFSPDDVNKLEDVIPDNVDNIRLIIDINNIAARHSLSLKDVQLGVVSDTAAAPVAAAVGSAGDAIGSVTLGFTVDASYDDFLAFMADLEHSVRILDIEKLSFTAEPSGKTTFDVTVRTYWLH